MPSFLSAEERQGIAEDFAAELVERYGVAVSVAMHQPGKNGDDRNYHAHILFTTREMTPEGLGKKTRILDDRKTGPGEVVKLRELAAGIINDALKAANSDIRVDHRSFKERGIEQEPTTHLGPAASEMERRGEATERGDFNRHVEDYNAMLAERAAMSQAIEDGMQELASPPRDTTAARELALALGARIRDYWQGDRRDRGGYGTDWTGGELDLIVADYFAMLADELAGRPYAKAAHNAALRERVPRSRGSVEFKYQNVSAVLEKLGMPWIPGYKPARHYQGANRRGDRQVSRQPSGGPGHARVLAADPGAG